MQDIISPSDNFEAGIAFLVLVCVFYIWHRHTENAHKSGQFILGPDNNGIIDPIIEVQHKHEYSGADYFHPTTDTNGELGPY